MTILHFGDSELEVKLGVAKGFPNDTLNDDQVIISKEFANYFNINKESYN